MERTADEIRRELQDRGRYYAKGFGAVLQAVTSNLEIYQKIGPSDEIRKHIENGIKIMTELYESFPSEIPGPDRDLLKGIKEAVFSLRDSIEGILSGQKSFLEAYDSLEKIDTSGKEFRERLWALLKELRTNPGCEQEVLSKTDLFGISWKSML